ncbi:MAG: hypothetical protein RLZZ303_2497 [Candidatus Hydrogenedentota bacterium]|jgi:glycosyltransferase involved in cell wall biosynthesis
MISVVICTYNRAAYLEQTLSTFFRQEHLDRVPHELIVVDNNSSDATPEVVQQFGSHKALHYHFESKQGLSRARNRGVAESRGEIIAYLDDDVLISPGWLGAVASCFEQTGSDVVGGRSILRFEAQPPGWFGPEFRRSLSEVDLGPLRIDAGKGQRLYGLNVSYRRKALVDAGGFRLHFGRSGGKLISGEELDLNRRIADGGGRLTYEPDALVEHVIPESRTTWEYMLKLQQGAVETRAMLDEGGNAATCLKHLADTAARLALFKIMRAASHFQGADSYAARLAQVRHMKASLLLDKRIEALTRSLVPSKPPTRAGDE